MTWDSVHQRIVLFGGSEQGGQSLTDLWAWDGTNWSLLMPATPSLGSSFGRTLVHDPLRDRLVLFSGTSGALNVAEWNGASWTTLTPSQSWPSSGSIFTAVFDPTTGRVMHYEPTAPSPRLSGWNGSAWTWQTVVGAPGMSGAQLVFDPQASRLLLVGGTNSSNPNTLFGWNAVGASWQPLAAGGPNSQQGDACYDSVRNRLVFVGAYTPGTWVDSSVWEWSGGPWQRRTQAPPCTRHTPSIAYDAVGGRTWLFGGSSADGPRGDLWSYDSAGWLLRGPENPQVFAPGVTAGRSLVYDEARQQLLLMAGDPSGFSMFRWTGSVWQSIAGSMPSQRSYAGVVYDRKRARVVLFGGQSLFGVLSNETWVYDGFAWTQLAPSNSPPGSARHGMAYDSKRDRVVLNGGDGLVGAAGATWEFDGQDWQSVPGAQALFGVRGPALAYDPAREVVVAMVPGPTDGTMRTWQWTGTTWVEATPSEPPPTRSLPSLLTTFDGTMAFGGLRTTAPFDYPADRRLLRSPQLAAASSFGAPGTSVAGPLTIAVEGNGPWLGSRVDLAIAGVPPIALPGMWAGASRTDWNGSPLPADLGVLGWPDTVVRVALEIFVPVLNLGSGRASTFVDLPADPVLVGLELHLQAFTFEPLIGALTSSNGITFTTGLR